MKLIKNNPWNDGSHDMTDACLWEFFREKICEGFLECFKVWTHYIFPPVLTHTHTLCLSLESKSRTWIFRFIVAATTAVAELKKNSHSFIFLVIVVVCVHFTTFKKFKWKIVEHKKSHSHAARDIERYKVCILLCFVCSITSKNENARLFVWIFVSLSILDSKLFRRISRLWWA